ncbi:MAG: Peptidase [Gammaproteobacteria bacterium]|nr:Peptidase [Gammaproteobacteria bacterium]
MVRPEDTLYSIAWRHGLDYRSLAKWNDIGADYRLSIGQVLVLEPSGRPPVSPAPSTATAPSRSAAAARGVPRVSKPTPLADTGTGGTATPAAPGGAPSAKSREPEPVAPGGRAGSALPVAPVGPMGLAIGGGGTKWVWPTDRLSAPRPVPGGGILLLGRLGQDVRAAGSGRVVYTGSGLRGYGNLIIVKHGESLLSSYAHNRELLVHEGQDVAAGQVIAHMGTGPHQVSALYFEIRVNGKPVDPLRYLTR